ncbi:MAG: hypothetical protein AAFO75_10855 [Pseudomonadota bacterium]
MVKSAIQSAVQTVAVFGAAAFALLGAFAIQQSAHAASLTSGEKTITVISASGERLRIGKVTFSPIGDGAEMAIKVDLDSPEFGDEFLSMRPFRCLQDPKELLCHLVYPHGLKRKVSADDLTDLEYELLFLFKPVGGYGIDAWNGLYFDLKLLPDGTISGPINEVDLNILAVPPEQEFARPISDGDLTEASANAHRFARMEIR